MNLYDCWKIPIRVGDGVITDRKYTEGKPPVITIGRVIGTTEDKVIVEVDETHIPYDPSALEVI
jgi:hypothetical protein